MLEVISINKEENLIFFLKGNLTKRYNKAFNDNIINLTKKLGAKNIIFETSNISRIDIKGIYNIIRTYDIANKN